MAELLGSSDWQPGLCGGGGATADSSEVKEVRKEAVSGHLTIRKGCFRKEQDI